jgi:hypothetical protein
VFGSLCSVLTTSSQYLFNGVVIKKWKSILKKFKLRTFHKKNNSKNSELVMLSNVLYFNSDGFAYTPLTHIKYNKHTHIWQVSLITTCTMNVRISPNNERVIIGVRDKYFISWCDPAFACRSCIVIKPFHSIIKGKTVVSLITPV